MKIQYASDLHLELTRNVEYLHNNPLNPVGDILLLAGDISNLGKEYESYPFWDWVSRHYTQTLIVPGNHEFYSNNMMKEMCYGYVCKIRENVLLCNNIVITLGNIDFILSTFWGYIRPEFQFITQKNVADFEWIKYNSHSLNVECFNEEHDKAMQFLCDAIAKSKAENRVVVTHHLPTEKCMSSEFKGSVINGAFFSEQYDFIYDNPIDFWVYGHSHRNVSPVNINGTTLLCNQLGYVQLNEENTFNRSACFEI